MAWAAWGVVYEAFDRQRGIRVALESLRQMDATALYRFKKEFRALCDLMHPNLVELHDLFGDNDDWFFTMELVVGTTFLKHVRPENFVPTGPRLVLEAAAEAFDVRDMKLYANIARRQRGQLVGGDEGEQAVLACDERMAVHGIRRPDRFAFFLSPGKEAGER